MIQPTDSENQGYVVGVDIGTSLVKAAVYTLDGEMVAAANAPIAVQRFSSGRVVQSLDDFYRAAAAQCRNCMVANDLDPGEVKAIAFSAQMAGVGLVDSNHAPLAPFDSWLDTRCGEIVDELEPHAEEVIAIAGCAPTVSIGPKMIWWKRHHPELCEDAASFVTAAGYVAGVACGLDGKSAFIDPTHLHFTAAADVAAATWNDNLVTVLGLDRELLPNVVESTDVVGHLTLAAATEFGLRAGVPVAAGCGDTAATALGAGALDSGVALDVAGTAAVFAAGTDEFLADVAHRTLMTMRAPLPGRWYALAYVGAAGQLIEWVCREILGCDDTDERAYAELGRAAADVEPGCDGLFMSPHFGGRVTPAALNMRGSIVGLSLAHGRAHIARAALESIAFEYRTYVDILQRLQPGWRLRRVIGAGGGIQSPIWNQIKADVLGAEYVPLLAADPGTRGAALIAIAALGYDLPAIPAAHPEATVSPNLANEDTYRQLHGGFVSWADRLAEGYSQINNTSNRSQVNRETHT